MKHEINLTEGTQILLDAILDLEQLSNSVYSFVRREFSERDSVDDETGRDIVEASLNLREVLNGYLRDQFNSAVTQTNNLSGGRVSI